jgi:hypothetical protein
MTFIIQMGSRYEQCYAGDFLVQDPALAKPFTLLADASAEVSRLAKAGFRNLRVLKFTDGEVTNLKE